MPTVPCDFPYIWATWLPRLLTGERSCEWAPAIAAILHGYEYRNKSTNRHYRSQPQNADTAAFIIIPIPSRHSANNKKERRRTLPNPRTPRRTEHKPTNAGPTNLDEAIQHIIDAIQAKTTIDKFPRRASALLNLTRIIYGTDGVIKPINAETFQQEPGTILFRGISHYKYARENLNGDWHGVGLFIDGNYYAGWSHRHESIGYHGLGNSQGWGWTIAYKLRPTASLVNPTDLLHIPISSFITKVRERFDISNHLLSAIYNATHETAFRAVLLGYDAAYIPELDHYVVYNNHELVHLDETAPWHQGLEEVPIEFQPNASPANSGTQPAKPSPQLIQSQVFAMHARGMDMSNPITLKYCSAAERVQTILEEVAP